MITTQQTTQLIALDLIIAGQNDRTIFRDSEIQELAENMSLHGLIQPPTVRPLPDGRFEVVAGERRTRAARQIGWTAIACYVQEMSDEEASAIMLAENAARADLDPIDEARAYASRMGRFGWSVERVAAAAGVSETRVHFRLKLLKLREDIQHLVRSNNLQMGYAQILADAELDANRQLIALQRLNEQKSPTPAWFRTEVGQLKIEQSQDSLFDLLQFTVDVPAEKRTVVDPPSPLSDVPPAMPDAALDELLIAHIAFWEEAARGWARLGKSFKVQQCEAAARALSAVLATLE